MSEQPPTPERKPEPPVFSWAPQEDGTVAPYDPTAYPEEELRRPGTVTAACVITWVFSVIALLAAAWMFIAVYADRDGFERSISEGQDLENVGLTADEVVTMVTSVSIAIALLSALAIVVAALAFRRTRWARVVLLLLSVVTSFASLLLSVAVVPFFWLLAAIAVMILLMLGRSKRWFKA
ncbi:hypothetical protein EKO23_08325 [Nocardioides guangzhouensis]|uniref:DUF4064 domain-containing protein n=1 Tax=Nocardioides guangzhouensis TaxID=2497878 RepID=A0A4Q4ZFR5_9ACTN|nr:hypothetical protein [Nocardioides guangzhouensis]RYP86668.1 hypothetical protein EKO23_08325 [Nocardioides guangzhouensis]